MEIKKCQECDKEFEVDCKNKRKKFCNMNCSAVFNNKKRGALNEEHKEKISSKLKDKWKTNPELFSTGESHSKKVGAGTKGKFKQYVKSIAELSTRTVQKILKRLKVKCSNCGWDKTTCDIHHINGRKIEDFNNHENLTLLCPNCHRLAHEGRLEKSKLKNLNSIIPENWREYYYG